MTDSTPRRSRRASARASSYGAPAAQLHLSVDERTSAERLYAAIRQSYDDYARLVAQQERRAGR